MRWLASLVVLALVAGTGVRPRVEIRQLDRQAQLAADDGLVPMVTARRGGAIAPDVRFTTVAIVPLAPSLAPPSRIRIADAAGTLARSLPLDTRAASARGPPDGRFSVEITVRS